MGGRSALQPDLHKGDLGRGPVGDIVLHAGRGLRRSLWDLEQKSYLALQKGAGDTGSSGPPVGLQYFISFFRKPEITSSCSGKS